MMIALFASLLLSIAGGILLTFMLFPPPIRELRDLMFRLFVGGGAGIGLSSCIFFVSLSVGLSGWIPLIDSAAFMLLCLIFYLLMRRGDINISRGPIKPQTAQDLAKPSDRLAQTPGSAKWTVLITAVFAVEFLATLGSLFVAFLKEPHGRWDAWLIWNMHARFLYRSGDAWREAFASGMDWSHWDYPLLLPLSIVRGWHYIGSESLNVPAIFALLFTILTVGLLLSSLAFLRGSLQGLLAAMVLLGTPFFIMMGASQFADIPFAFFMLATIVMIFVSSSHSGNRPGAMVMAGIAAALCAWTKNEGLLFLLIATASTLCVTLYAEGWRPGVQKTFRLLAGALPILLVVIYFKIRLSPANDIVAGFTLNAVAAKLTDPGRYAEIAKAFFLTGLSFTQGLVDLRVGMGINPGAVSLLLPIAYLIITGIRIDDRDRPGLALITAVVALMGVGYFFVYLLTPLDLGYHLATSLNRLFLQLWPSVIFLFFLVAGGADSFASALKPATLLREHGGRSHGHKRRK